MSGSNSYGRGAKILSAGIATTGLVTFAYFSLAAHALDEVEYKRISLLWSIMFVVASVIYRPIEQLLSRTIAEGRARGATSHPLRQALTIQASFALGFLVVALVLRGPIKDDLFDGSSALYWILVAGVLFYAASYFARGYVAGHQQFELYGGLVFLEATSRVLFAVAAVVGVTSGQTAVALGMAAGPLISLLVVPAVLRKRESGGERAEAKAGMAGFAVAVLAIMAAEQTLINAAVLTVDGTSSDPALAGVVFSVLLIARAPLQLFQAIQGSLLPHLAALDDQSMEFKKAVRLTVLAMATFSGAVALGLVAIGPEVMKAVFDLDRDVSRWGLALVAIGMGFHLVAGTFNQAELARDRAPQAARAWVISAVAFVVWMLLPIMDDQLLRAEVGYCGAAALLCTLLTISRKA